MKHTFVTRILSYGLRVGLLFLALTTAGVLVFGSPDGLKTSLQDSGAYPAAAEQLSRQAGEAIRNQADLKVNQSTVETAAQQAFPPQTIQNSTEQVIDGGYDWLQGKTERPEINLDLSPYVDDFVQSVSNQAEQRVAGLPVCTAEQLRQIDPNNINVYELPCRPQGIDLGSAKQLAINQAVASNEFLQNPVVSTDNLPKDAEGKTALDRADSVPQAFQLLMIGPWIFGGLAIICAALLLWLICGSDGWRAGVRKLARSLLGVGITLLVLVAIVKLFFRYVTASDGIAGKLVAGEFQEVAIAFVESLEQAYNAKLLVFGIVYAVAAIIALLLLRFWKQRVLSPASVSAATPASPVTDRPVVPTEKLPVTPSPHNPQGPPQVPVRK